MLLENGTKISRIWAVPMLDVSAEELTVMKNDDSTSTRKTPL